MLAIISTIWMVAASVQTVRLWWRGIQADAWKRGYDTLRDQRTASSPEHPVPSRATNHMAWTSRSDNAAYTVDFSQQEKRN